MTLVTQLKPLLMLGTIILVGGTLFFIAGAAYGLNADDIQDMQYAKEKAESLDMSEELPNGQEMRVGGALGQTTEAVIQSAMWEGAKWGANNPDVTTRDFALSVLVEILLCFGFLYRLQWRSLEINDWPRRWVAA